MKFFGKISLAIGTALLIARWLYPEWEAFYMNGLTSELGSHFLSDPPVVQAATVKIALARMLLDSVIIVGICGTIYGLSGFRERHSTDQQTNR